MADLRRVSPLDDVAPLTLPRLSVRARAQPTVTELRGNSDLRHEDAFALLPSPTRSRQHGNWRAAWIRPDGWLLIESPDVDAARVSFAGAQRRRACRLVDLSHGMTQVSLAGAAARELLAQGTPLDLRPAAFGIGRCARTRCADFTVLLDHGPDGFDVYVDAPLAQAFWNWLMDAAQNVSP